MKSPSTFLRGAFRSALRLALLETFQGMATRNEVHQSREDASSPTSQSGLISKSKLRGATDHRQPRLCRAGHLAGLPTLEEASLLSGLTNTAPCRVLGFQVVAAEHLRPALPREPVSGEVTEAVRMERITAQHKPTRVVRGNVVGDLFYCSVVRCPLRRTDALERSTAPFQTRLATRAGGECMARVLKVVAGLHRWCGGLGPHLQAYNVGRIGSGRRGRRGTPVCSAVLRVSCSLRENESARHTRSRERKESCNVDCRMMNSCSLSWLTHAPGFL